MKKPVKVITYQTKKGIALLPKIRGQKVELFTAEAMGSLLGINWKKSPFNVETFRKGMQVELEHGLVSPLTNVTDNDALKTAKIALAHLKEFSDYYDKLEKYVDPGTYLSADRNNIVGW
jgi:hypothetical protein